MLICPGHQGGFASYVRAAAVRVFARRLARTLARGPSSTPDWPERWPGERAFCADGCKAVRAGAAQKLEPTYARAYTHTRILLYTFTLANVPCTTTPCQCQTIPARGWGAQLGQTIRFSSCCVQQRRIAHSSTVARGCGRDGWWCAGSCRCPRCSCCSQLWNNRRRRQGVTCNTSDPARG